MELVFSCVNEVEDTFYNCRHFISYFFCKQTFLVVVGRTAYPQWLKKPPLTSEYRTAFGNIRKREKVNGVSKHKFYRQVELSAVSSNLTSEHRVSFMT
jgi:hypothetical protein